MLLATASRLLYRRAQVRSAHLWTRLGGCPASRETLSCSMKSSTRGQRTVVRKAGALVEEEYPESRCKD